MERKKAAASSSSTSSSRSGKHLYLLKVPTTLLERFDQTKGSVLGYIEKCVTKGNENLKRLHIKADEGNPEEMFSLEEVEFDRDSTLMFSGSSDIQKQDATFEGVLKKVWAARPSDVVETFANRIEAIQTSEEAEQKRWLKKLQTQKDSLSQNLDRVRKRPSEDGEGERRSVRRRELHVRRPRPEVEEMVLEAFGKEEYYTIRQLVRITDQPQEYLRGILRDMCDLHREGEHIHQYSLKPVYGKVA